MLRRNICNEAGARSDGLMFVSVLFISAFTYIAITTNPVYTGIGVGDRAPELVGDVWDGSSWTEFDLHKNLDENANLELKTPFFNLQLWLKCYKQEI